MIKLLISLGMVALLGLLPATAAFSQSKESEAAQQDISKAVSPNKAKRRFFLRNEYREREDNAAINIFEALYDLPLNDDLVLRTQVPYVTNNPTTGSTSNGLGDITNVLDYRYKREGSNSYAIGLEARWNTAADRALGVGNTLLAPTWSATINVPKYNTILFPQAQIFFSVAHDDGREELNYTALKPRWLTKLKNRYYTFVEPVVYIDHESDNKTTGVLEVELGRFVNAQTMAYARPGAGLWGETDSRYLYEWNFEIGARYFFK